MDPFLNNMKLKERILKAKSDNPNFSLRELAKLVGCDHTTVLKYLKQIGVSNEKHEVVSPQGEDKELLKMLAELSPTERKVLIRGLGKEQVVSCHDHHWSSKHIRFGYFSDPHIGHSEFCLPLFEKMVSLFKKEKIDVVYSPGDIVEGMSGRPGHIYELTHIGASAQAGYAAELISQIPSQVFSILGNHDLWFKEKRDIGLNVGELIASRCKNFTCLGEWEADVTLADNVVMKLFHSNDGAAYATSYKIQKLIESLTGGEKPSVILSGHYHKQLELFTRNVFGFECGTLCGQSRFMRGKKIAAHMGFGIIDIWVNATGIERLRHEFVPHFV
jgi:predicted phosphodiesterase